MDLLTTSAQRTYRACPRRYFLSYEQGYRPIHAADPLAFGTLGHRGLEAWWKAIDACANCGCLRNEHEDERHDDKLRRCGVCALECPGFVAKTPEDAWDDALHAIATEEDPYQRARAQAMMAGYHARWADMTWDGQPITVLGVEVEFSGALLNPETGAASRTWERAGKLDALVEAGGRVYVLEHKTSSADISPGSDYWALLTLDPQVSNYVSGARLLGHDVAGVIYDVIRKPGLKPLKATPEEQRRYRKKDGALDARQRAADETPEEFYDRLIDDLCGDDGEAAAASYRRALVVRLETEEREAAADLWATGVQIREARRLNVWPRNPDACVKFGHKCAFWDACVGVASLDDPTRFRRVENVHEELTIARPVADAAE